MAECLIPVHVPGKTKIQTQDYKVSGRFPIIDQAREPIAGWTDDENAVIRAPLPLIVFGDHTRVFKFTDRAFARGADGTQLLRPKATIDPLFFFYACRAIDLPSRGYNRHFTTLKQKTLSYPHDKREQQLIAAVMQQVEAVLVQQTALARTLLQLKNAVTTELFTHGLRGEPQKETKISVMPEGWGVEPFDAAVAIAQGQVDPKVSPYDSLLHVGPENVEPNTGRLLPCRTAKDLGLISGKYHFAPGDIVYSKIRPYLNKAVMPDFEGICSADMYPLRAKEGFDARFIFHFLLSRFFLRQAIPHQLRTGIPKINREQLSDTAFPKPPLIEQREIVDVLDAIDEKIDLHQRKAVVVDELFTTLLHELMMGQIRAADLDMSAIADGSLAEMAS